MKCGHRSLPISAPDHSEDTFRIFRDASDEPEWHQVHVSGSVFDTAAAAEEAARSMALEKVLARGNG